MHEALSERGQAVWIGAQDEARAARNPEVNSAHLLLAITAKHPGIAQQALGDLGATPGAVRKSMRGSELRLDAETDQRIALASDLKSIFSTVMRQAPRLGPRRVEPHHLLLALAEHPESAGARILLRLGIPLADVRVAVARLLQLDDS
jgi:ATP-dependent Clp protease ATP-binding subunit ClpB